MGGVLKKYTFTVHSTTALDKNIFKNTYQSLQNFMTFFLSDFCSLKWLILRRLFSKFAAFLLLFCSENIHCKTYIYHRQHGSTNLITFLNSRTIERNKKRNLSVVLYKASTNSILGNCALHLTHPSAHTHTHTPWTHTAAAPGEQLGVRCLAQGSHLSHGIEGGESAGYSLPPPTIPAGSETRTCNLWVTSPTL